MLYIYAKRTQDTLWERSHKDMHSHILGDLGKYTAFFWASPKSKMGLKVGLHKNSLSLFDEAATGCALCLQCVSHLSEDLGCRRSCRIPHWNELLALGCSMYSEATKIIWSEDRSCHPLTFSCGTLKNIFMQAGTPPALTLRKWEYTSNSNIRRIGWWSTFHLFPVDAPRY